LADIISTIPTGRPARVVSQGPNEEEMEKRLFAILYAGDPVIVIDNIEHPIEGAALCSILTQETWKGRILGKSETAELPTKSLFIATGNNLTIRGDLTRRVVICRLDARSERPDERAFDFDPVELARQRRSELVVAGLTIIRGYIAGGRPMKGKIADVGSFEDWTIIREVLAWLDQPDPAVTRKLVLGDDPTRQELYEIMNLWHECFGNKAMTIADVGREIEKTKTGNVVPSNSLIALETALKQFDGNTEINAKKLDAGSNGIVELSSKVAISNGITVLAATSATGWYVQRPHRDDTMSDVMHVLHVIFAR
jgi:hypothetical protein